VNDLFTWERVANGLAAVYEEVLLDGRLARRDEAERLATVDRRFAETIEVLTQSRRRLRASLLEAADEICRVLARDGRVLIAGNGGSAAEAQHMAAELVGRFRVAQRAALPALALGTDSAVLSAWANDASFLDVYAREVQAHGRRGDLLIGLSTSGRSVNLIRAFEQARRTGVRTLALLGGDGGTVQSLADLAIVVPSANTQHIQEAHTVMVHLLCELVETRLDDAGWFDGTVVETAGEKTPARARGRERTGTGVAAR
jgi:phosphoheptose isomerase